MRTCSTMIFTDGSTMTLAVMRGPMKGKSFNAHRAEIVGRYNVLSPRADLSLTARVDYLKRLERNLTALFATDDAPPVDWQA